MIDGGSNGGLFQFIAGSVMGSLLIASGLIVMEAFAALSAAMFPISPLIVLLVAIVLFTLISLVAYLYYLELDSPCYVSGFGFAASIPLLELPKFFGWLFGIVGWTMASDAPLSCVRGE